MAYVRSQLATSTGGSASAARINALVEVYISLQPDDPLYVQYIDYVTAVAQGDLGKSLHYGEPVEQILMQAVPWTLFYASVALILMYILGIIGGALLAFYEGTTLDKAGSTVLITANSVPYYIIGMVLLAVLGFQMNVFPTGGKVDPDLTAGFSPTYVGSMFYHAILPILSFVLTAVGGVVLTMRGNSIQVLGSEYMRVGRLRGLSDSWLSRHYVAHNAVLPLYTQLLTSVGFVFGGSVILETIFRYQGAGYYIYQGIQTRDQPLMMGGFLMITLAVVIALFFADLTYSLIDPRLSTEGEEAY